MSPKKALYFSVCIRMLMVLFCISLCFVKLIETDNETKEGSEKKLEKELVLSIQRGALDESRALLAKGVRPIGVLADGTSPLHMAVIGGYHAFVKELFSYFADAQLVDHAGKTAVHVVAASEPTIRNELLGCCLLNGGSLETLTREGRSYLDELITLRSVDGVRDFLSSWGWVCSAQLLRKGKEWAGVEAGKGLGLTDIAQVLQQHASPLEECSKASGLPPLVLCLLKDEEEALVYMELHKDVWDQSVAQRYDALPVLFVAILQGRKKCVKRLLSHKGVIEGKDVHDRTVLHMICGSKRLSEKRKVKLLRLSKEGGAVYAKDKRGDTPLHVAVKEGQAEVVRTLMELYTRTVGEEKNNAGHSPKELAIRAEMKEIAALMEQKEVFV